MPSLSSGVLIFVFLSTFVNWQHTLTPARPESPTDIKIYPGICPLNSLTVNKHSFCNKHKKCSTGHLLYLFGLMLLNASDCHPNPGPRAPKYPCGECGKACVWSKTIKSIECTDCGKWYHKSCINMPSGVYEGLDGNDISWNCCLCDFLFKFLVIGSAGAGKSCILHQFIENKFKQDSNHTIGVEFGSKVVNVGGKSVKLQIWDTAGQERFRSVTRSYYRGAAGALLVYDISSRETYNALTNWLTDARTLASPNIVIILVGNKKDLEVEREVTFLEASRFAQENDLMFLETSALTGENVEETFLKCARQILSKIESGELDPERMGSGIQYGDASVRRQQRLPSSTPPRPDCSC